jgi:hypothetical protein
MSRVWWLARQIPGFMSIQWIITLGLAVWLGLEVIATAKYLVRSKQKVRASWLLQLVPLVITFSILLLGAIYECRDCSPGMPRQFHDSSRFVLTINEGLLVFQIGVASLLVSLARETKSLFTAVQVALFFLSYWGTSIAYMNIMNSWP